MERDAQGSFRVITISVSVIVKFGTTDFFVLLQNCLVQCTAIQCIVKKINKLQKKKLSSTPIYNKSSSVLSEWCVIFADCRLQVEDYIRGRHRKNV